MKKISRLLAILLVLLMLATMSVSCKKKDDGDDEAIVDTDDGANNENSVDADDNGDDGASDDKEDSKDTNKKEENKTDSSTNNKTETVDKEQAIEQGTQKGEGHGTWVEDEDGNILSTNDHEVDDEYRIQGAVTNDNGFIPDEEQGLEKSDRFATEQSKYNFDQNPLINRDRQVNREAMPSFDINDTGFVRAGTKLSDLKGKKLEFFTADTFAAWSYRNAKGETIDEWTWFKDLKDELGLSIKYTMKQHEKSINSTLQNMNAGKQCDLIYTNHVTLCPQALCISKSITSLVNINNLGSSPGVCKKSMDLCKWGNTLRLIAPIGVVDVLWYNQTLNQELNLSDPHVMWEKGKWDWDAFKKYMISVPKTTKDGAELVSWTCFWGNFYFTWDSTNGKPTFEIVADAKVPTIKNNWQDPQVLQAWEFIASVNQNTNHQQGGDNGGLGIVQEHMNLYLGTTLMSATMYTQVYRDTEYSKHIQINWVPFPKANTETGKETAQYYGFGMVLPRKTAKPENENIALKFMELWATRFTETYFDNLNTFEYYNFNYKQRKQYFDFVTQHVVYSPGITGIYGNMREAFRGNAAYNVKTEATKYANEAAKKLAELMKYGG